MPGVKGILLIPEPSWQDTIGLVDALQELDIKTEQGTLKDLAPAITPFDLASLRGFLDDNVLETVTTPTQVEIDYENRLWNGETKSIGALYHGPNYCSFMSNNLLRSNVVDHPYHPVIVTPRILAEYSDRVHARTFYAYWPTIISFGGMQAALAKDETPLTQQEQNSAAAMNILSSLLHVYRDEPFCEDQKCFHFNPHTISGTRNRNNNTGCPRHSALLSEILDAT